VAVAAAWQVDTDFLLDEYLKTLHSFTGPRDIQLVVRVAHIDFSPSFQFRKAGYFPDGMYLVSFRTPSLARVESCMNVKWRKEWYNLQRE